MDSQKVLITFLCEPAFSVWVEKCSSYVISIIFRNLELFIFDAFI